jgi:hypothetical protein|tara:strand:+ start:446 stop:670 length:225 start_codon:yes stop_codon:yes gene_type:complete
MFIELNTKLLNSSIPTTKINNIQNRNTLKQITNIEENCFLNNKITTNIIIAAFKKTPLSRLHSNDVILKLPIKK